MIKDKKEIVERIFSSRTRKFLKSLLRNKVTNRKYPFFGAIETTRRCNSKCIFCPIGSQRKEFIEGEMSTEEIKHIIDQFVELDILGFSFLGGEPTLRSDVCEIGHYARQNGIFSQLTTNGLLLEDRAEEYTEALDVIVVSLDTKDQETYKRLRNVDAFHKVIDGIKAAVENGKKNRCSIVTNTTICAANLDEIEEVVMFCDSLGVDGIMLEFATFHEYWNTTVESNSAYRPDEMDFWKFDKQVKDIVVKLIEMKKSYPLITSKSYLEAFLAEEFDFKCYPYLFCCVNKDGGVAIPCWDHPQTKFFDILHEHNLKDLWLSKEIREEREKIKDCKACYMHCIVEPSKVLGATLKNFGDMLEWLMVFWRTSGRNAERTSSNQ